MFIELLDDSAVKIKGIDGKNKTINVKFIKNVHSWTNIFVHSGYAPWFWKVEFIREILQDFIFGNIEIDRGYSKKF